MSIFFLILWEEFNQVNFILLINIVPSSMPFRHSHYKFIHVPLCLMDARLNRVSCFELTFARRRRCRWPNESRENRERAMRKQNRIGNNLYLHFGLPPGLFRTFHSRISLSRPRPRDDILAFASSFAPRMHRNVKREHWHSPHCSNAINILHTQNAR